MFASGVPLTWPGRLGGVGVLGKSFDKLSTMPLTSNFYGRKSNSNVYKSFKLESRERYTEPGTGAGAAAGVEWDREQCLSSG